MEHHELVAEMAYIEKLSTQERLKLARRRRVQQLKKYSQKEKDTFQTKKEKTAQNEARKNMDYKVPIKTPKVLFTSNVMILEAAARNDIEEVKFLLENGVNPDSTNEDGLTALHQCCIDDSEEMMRLLVYYGANVNAQDSEKWTPLHAAATCGHLHLAKFLISKGSNLLAVNADGNMPYDICEDDATLDYIENEMASRGVTQQLIDDTRAAVERKMLAELKKMKLEGKSLMCRDEHGATPLHIAAANGYQDVVEYLITQNIPVEVQDNDDWSPLHAAACWGHPDVLEILVQHGANLQAKTKNQETPFDICEDIELRERIMQLVNEQETKRLNGQNKRIRRVRSNKRTQSIRRTSIREKILIPKKEAQEEARMRMQLDNNYFGNFSDDGLPSRVTDSNQLSLSIKDDYDAEEKENIFRSKSIIKTSEIEHETVVEKSESPLTTNFYTSSLERGSYEEEKSNFMRELEGCHIAVNSDVSPNETCVSQSVNHVQVSLSSSDAERRIPPVPPPRSSSNPSSRVAKQSLNDSTDSSGNNKIDIHVTVTVNPFSPGTLQDLKRQRALSRASQNSGVSATQGVGSSSLISVSTGTSEFDSMHSKAMPITSFQRSTVNTVESLSVQPPSVLSYASQPSPSQSPRRYCGQPNDVIGKERVPCCGLM